MPTLEITTVLGCSLACKFCPQDKLVKNYPKGNNKVLPLEKYKLALSKVPHHVSIHFSGMSEPWLNKEATEMVLHTIAQKRRIEVYTTLTGLNPTDALSILQAQEALANPIKWVIHLPDDENNMRGWKMSDDYLKTLEVFINYKNDKKDSDISFMTMSSKGQVIKEISEVFKQKLAPFVGISRAENLNREQFESASLTNEVNYTTAVMCKSTPFFDHNGLMPNGDVVLCCMDYSMKNVIGNLFEMSYQDIFSSPAMNLIRFRSMTPGEDKSFICKKCENAVCVSNPKNEWQLDSSSYWAENPQIRYQYSELHEQNEKLKSEVSRLNTELGSGKQSAQRAVSAVFRRLGKIVGN